MATTLNEHIVQVRLGLQAIRSHFSTQTTFTELSDAFAALQRLEECMAIKQELDTLIAYLADKRGAGQLARSSRAADFIAYLYDISPWKAQQRINEANDIYAPPTPPPPPPEPEPEPEPEQPDDDGHAESEAERAERARREEEERRRREEEERRRQERLKREQEAHDRLKNKLGNSPISAEKQQIITQELKRLQPEASIGKKELYAQAVDQARLRNARDLRQWLRRKIDRANGAAKNPVTIHNLRSLNIGPTDANGGARFSGYAPPAMLALLDAILKPARRPAHDPELRNDHRTPTQRRADALMTAMREFSAMETAQHHGVTSIVVSFTVDDVKEMADPAAAALRRYATNTHATLTAFDVMLLGAGPLGYTTLLSNKGQALSAAKFRRSASLEQKIALIASELVCTHPGCDEPAINCEVHHIRPWARGGETTLSNLTLLCRGHHMQNNDSRSPRDTREYAERDPESGRVGKKAPPTPGDPDPRIRFNDSVAAEQSAGSGVRRKYRGKPGGCKSDGKSDGDGDSCDTEHCHGRDRSGPDTDTPRARSGPDTADAGLRKDDTGLDENRAEPREAESEDRLATLFSEDLFPDGDLRPPPDDPLSATA